MYQSLERGMKENDLLLGTFAKKYLGSFNEEELREYDRIIQEPDPDVFKWITEKVEVPQELRGSIMKRIQQHCKSNPLEFNPNLH